MKTVRQMIVFAQDITNPTTNKYFVQNRGFYYDFYISSLQQLNLSTHYLTKQKVLQELD